MNQKGFINIIFPLIIVVLVGFGAYFLFTKQINLLSLSLTSKPTLTPEATPILALAPASTPKQSPQSNNFLSVLDLTGNKEAYVGKRVRVQGRIAINVSYGERQCLINEPVCDTSMGAQLELWQLNTVSGDENFVFLFNNNQPYPCTKSSPGIYACSSYTDKQITTIEGVWKKDQVAIQWVGSSGGKPATPVKWADRYFLNIE